MQLFLLGQVCNSNITFCMVVHVQKIMTEYGLPHTTLSLVVFFIKIPHKDKYWWDVIFGGSLKMCI